MTDESFLALRDEAAEKYFLYPGVLEVDVRENLLRIKVKDQDVADAIPKTFTWSKNGYEIGTEITITG